MLVNYRTVADWPAAVRAATGGRGVDIFVDVAGAGQVAVAASVVAEGDIIAAVGRLTGEASRGMEAGVPVASITVGNRDMHEAMLAFAAARGIRPVVDAVYDLARLPDALRRLESGAFFGRIPINLA